MFSSIAILGENAHLKFDVIIQIALKVLLKKSIRL